MVQMQSRVHDHIPRFGWTPVELIDETLTDVEWYTEVIQRTDGLLRATLSARVPANSTGGTGFFSVALWGSNTGGSTLTDWQLLATLNGSDLFDVTVLTEQVRILGAEVAQPGAIPVEGGTYLRGAGQISLGRHKYLRVSAVDVSGNPTYEMEVRLTGIAGDGETIEKEFTLTKPSAGAYPVSDPVKRSAGTRYLTCEVMVSAIVLDPDPSLGAQATLQGAVSAAAVVAGEWYPINAPFIPDTGTNGPLNTVDDAIFFKQGQTRVLDMGPFEYFRVLTSNAENPANLPNSSGPLTSWTLDVIFTFDDNDWLDGDIDIARLSEQLEETFIKVVFSEPGAQVVNDIDIALEVVDINDQPMGRRRIGLVLNDDANAGLLAPSAVATFTAISPAGASFIYPVAGGAAAVIIETDFNGIAVVTVNSAAAVDAFIEAFNFVPYVLGLTDFELQFGPGQALISTDRKTLPFV
jgi:hypothetical protein